MNLKQEETTENLSADHFLAVLCVVQHGLLHFRFASYAIMESETTFICRICTKLNIVQ